MARRRGSFDRRSLAGSIAVHAGIVALAILSSASARPPLEFVTYQIELVSPPPTVEAETPRPAEEELVVERPDPVPPEPEEEPEATLEQEDRPPEPEVTQADPVEQPVEAATEDPDEDPRESGEDINVRLEGVRRDYPAYYNNIIPMLFSPDAFKQELLGLPEEYLEEFPVPYVITKVGSVQSSPIRIDDGKAKVFRYNRRKRADRRATVPFNYMDCRRGGERRYNRAAETQGLF